MLAETNFRFVLFLFITGVDCSFLRSPRLCVCVQVQCPTDFVSNLLL